MSDHDLTREQIRMAVRVSCESDEELALRATQEVEAFQELYHRYKLPVYRYHLAQTGNEQEAQDLTSRTFLAAFECITSYQFGGCFVSWFFRLASHVQGNHLTRWGDNNPLDTSFGIPGNGSKPRREATFQITIDEIARVIDALPDDMAEALTLRFFAGLNPSEIGLVMVKSDAAIKMLVYRGLCELKARLISKVEIEHV